MLDCLYCDGIGSARRLDGSPSPLLWILEIFCFSRSSLSFLHSIRGKYPWYACGETGMALAMVASHSPIHVDAFAVPMHFRPGWLPLSLQESLPRKAPRLMQSPQSATPPTMLGKPRSLNLLPSFPCRWMLNMQPNRSMNLKNRFHLSQRSRPSRFRLRRKPLSFLFDCLPESFPYGPHIGSAALSWAFSSIYLRSWSFPAGRYWCSGIQATRCSCTPTFSCTSSILPSLR